MVSPSPLVRDVADFEWSLCRVFLAVARRGSVAGAVAELGISHPTVRRQLERLEVVLGAPLFSRSQTGMVPTQLALGLLEHAEAMERSARSMVRAAGSEELSGTVRISADDLVRSEVLPPILAKLRSAYPGLRYEIVGGSADVMLRDADVGVHLTAPLQRSVVASRVATTRFGLFASRDWIDANGRPRDRRTLVEAGALVGEGRGPEAIDDFGFKATTDAFCVTAGEVSNVMILIVAGLGVGAVPIGLAERRGGLVRVLPDLSTERDVWMTVHPNLKGVPHVRRVLDAIRAELPGWVGRT